MRRAHPTERAVGVEWYASDADGTGGRLRERPEDFRVREVEADLDPAPADADRGDYPHLLVRATLRRWDTNDFAARLGDALGMSRERVSWAGTKDKHAVTTQLFALRDVDADDLPDVRGADLTVLGRVGRALTFGDLAGNAFEVRVADPDAPEAATAVTTDLRAFAGLDDAGADGAATVAVPNYFGHQRFGSRRPVTHEVGLRILRRDWRGAVLAYCGNPAEAEPEDTRTARAFVDEEAANDDPDWGRAAERLPRALGHERAMLNRLAEVDDECGDDPDWRHALEAVPSNLQRLFVNAAQSYAFNRIVSERMARGLPLHEPVPGDVVCFADRDAPDSLVVPDPGRTQRVDADRVDVVARHCRRGRAFVTAPLVGTGTTFAGGEPGEIARSVCDDLGLEPADFDLPDAFASRGTRRAVICRTDLTVERDPLRFSFALPSGCYATTLLREYLKRDPRDL